MRAQSLQTFEETITSSLVLGDVSKWDGRIQKAARATNPTGGIDSGARCALPCCCTPSPSRVSPIALLQNLPRDGAAPRVLEMVSCGVISSPSATWSYPCGCPILWNVPQSGDTKPGVKRRKPNGLAVLPIFKVVKYGRTPHPFGLVYPCPVRDAQCLESCCLRHPKGLGHYCKSQTGRTPNLSIWTIRQVFAVSKGSTNFNRGLYPLRLS